MHLRRLTVEGLRCLTKVDIEPDPGINLIVGPNGAGKTSVLEAVYLLSRGRSFRTGGDAALLQHGAAAYRIHAELDDGAGRVSRLGLGREAARWKVRVDGEDRSALGDLLQHCAVVCFEPGSHELLAGGSLERRRFLDWGVFHVEHGYLEHWRRYQRALRQRNSLLRAGAATPELLPWEIELDAAAAIIDERRSTYMQRLQGALVHEIARLVSGLGEVQLCYQRGWAESGRLSDVLAATRQRDLARGHTGAGPHRADWRLAFRAAPEHEHLSRGQEKLAALACVLAQAALHAETQAAWPVICLDDLASELDSEHQRNVIERVLESGAQTWITGTGVPAVVPSTQARLFHVEHGRISPG
jgi:DNA replication and repair protein RecF